jgi:hypothetical protein
LSECPATSTKYTLPPISRRERRWLVAPCGVLANMIEEGPWAIGGAIAAGIAAAVAIFGFAYEFMVQPFVARHKLKKPCKAWFCISSTKQRKVTYAEQDSREHLVEELTLYANSEIEIELGYMSSVSLSASEIYFGCSDQNDLEIEKKPYVKSFFSRFVERSTREESPDTHPDTHYTDHHKYYHIKKTRHVAHGEIYSIGVKIQTREPGRYPFNIIFLGDEVGTIRNKMFIRVEEEPKTRMRCVHWDHRWTGCFIQPKKDV